MSAYLTPKIKVTDIRQKGCLMAGSQTDTLMRFGRGIGVEDYNNAYSEDEGYINF